MFGQDAAHAQIIVKIGRRYSPLEAISLDEVGVQRHQRCAVIERFDELENLRQVGNVVNEGFRERPRASSKKRVASGGSVVSRCPRFLRGADSRPTATDIKISTTKGSYYIRAKRRQGPRGLLLR